MIYSIPARLVTYQILASASFSWQLFYWSMILAILTYLIGFGDTVLKGVEIHLLSVSFENWVDRIANWFGNVAIGASWFVGLIFALALGASLILFKFLSRSIGIVKIAPLMFIERVCIRLPWVASHAASPTWMLTSTSPHPTTSATATKQLKAVTAQHQPFFLINLI